jgi:hypothetical protein
MQVAILLSCRNGQAFLPDFLDSLLGQTHLDWQLYWRDDGSSDATVAILRDFAAGPGAGRCAAIADPAGRLGITRSFLTLLRTVTGAHSPPLIAFADQDDVWLPEKLARGVAALARLPPARPALYCARQILVGTGLERLGVSASITHAPGFLPALTSNIATGCTVMMNQAAACLVAESRVPPDSVHDWWCYLLVAAAGGEIVADSTPTVLYRQHAGNAIGAPCSVLRRGVLAVRRGPGAFMNLFRSHVAALRAQPERLTPEVRAQLDVLDGALASGLLQRVRCLRMPQLRRQTWYENAVFACWFALG